MILLKEALRRLIRNRLGLHKTCVSLLHSQPVHGFTDDVYLEKAREYCREFIAPVENETLMRNIMKSLADQLDLACFSEKKNLTSLATKNTFMQDFASSSENGQFLSLLIGDELELMMVTIHNELVKKSDKKTLKLNNFQKYNYSIDMLVALVAEFLIEYIRDDIPFSELEGRLPPIVITYTLPHWIDQTSLNKGRIIKSHKGALLPRSQQHNLHDLLKSMMECWGYKLNIKCIMSFGAACFHDKQRTLNECIASIVLDHGITICHREETEELKGFDETNLDMSKPSILMMTDLAEFGRNKELASITTEYDTILDQYSSSLPGKKIFRKFVSETYFGELFRLIAVKLISDGFLLHSVLTYQIKRPFSILSEDVAYFENWMNKEKKCEQVLKYKLGYSKYGMKDLMILSYVADVITDRSTRLVALTLAALAERSSHKEIGFVFLGNLVSQHRVIRNRLSDYVRFYTRHLNKNIRVLKASSDSALRGAALFASRLYE